MEKETETFNLTPTWEALLPVMLLVLENGSTESKEEIKGELKRMAKGADLYNEWVKTQKDN